MLEFVNLLDRFGPQDLHVADKEGWTALHRVAAYATPSEVMRLIELGADPEQVALPLRWSAVHHAVFYGNYATFRVLFQYYEDIASMTDERGWTLLHIAASAGHDDIVRHLLRLGADPIARSKPFGSHMPEILYQRKCTPQEVAAAQSFERERQYLDSLRDLGLSGKIHRHRAAHEAPYWIISDITRWVSRVLALMLAVFNMFFSVGKRVCE